MPVNSSQTYITAHAKIFDSGGLTGNYGNNENDTLIICPSDSGCRLGLSFYGFQTEFMNDSLWIYSGIGTSNPLALVWVWTGCYIYYSLDSINGCLTMTFHSNGTLTDFGWEAVLVCLPMYPVAPNGYPGSSCYDAIPITLPLNWSFESTYCHSDAYHNGQSGVCSTYNQGQDKVYKYTASGPECLSISLSNIIMPYGNSKASISVYYQCPGSGGYCLSDTFINVNPPSNASVSTNVNLPMAGNYYIMIDAGPTGSDWLEYAVNINSCTVGIEEASSASFTILPNPSSGAFMIQTNQSLGNSTIVISNILGEQIIKQKIISPQTQINLSNEPDGIYFIQLRNKGQTITRKILLSK